MIIRSKQVVNLRHEVVDTVHAEVESCEAAGEETSPPPVIILGWNNKYNSTVKILVKTYLGTQVEIAEQDGGLRAGNDQNDEDEEEKSVPGRPNIS